ncbi:TetR/AcrR family transcriptional regulator [uncultured Ferrimonas sp.]|uniref:TetR/AcrR family transcriptional regulator n=1 Tax=uncultured Ferrimonas sp. TaxID=432640 RepID=UPI00262BFA5B|nr:TetR/AcrR family transcriptional regulator [uncultured Ferrimonas sp.]
MSSSQITSKKQLLLDTALTLFVEQGIEATATAQIARSAGVANGTLFHHFSSKSVLVNALFTEVKTELAQQMRASIGQLDQPAPLQQQALQIWRSGLNWALTHPRQLRFLQQIHFHPTDALRQHTVDQLFAFVDCILQQGQQQEGLPPLPPELINRLAHAQFLTCAAWLIEQGSNQPHAQHIDASFAMLWRALGASSPHMAPSMV